MAQTLVLNNAYQPLGGISEHEAVCLLACGAATIVRGHPERVYRSQHLAIPAPEIIILGHYVKMKGFKIRPEKLGKLNNGLFKRDSYTCQYCGRHRSELKYDERLTRDHIIPRSRGGKDDWENVVTACSTCNQKKDDRTPKEAGLRLRTIPKVPVTWTIRGKSKLTKEQIEYIEATLNLKGK